MIRGFAIRHTIACLTIGALALSFASGLDAETSNRNDLLDIYAAAISSDPVYAVADANYQATLQAKPQARAALLPQISGFAGYSLIDQRFKNANPIFSAIGNTDYDSQSYGIRLDQMVFNRQARIRLQQADTTIAKAAVAITAARQDLIVRVTQAYFDVLIAQDNLNFARSEKTAIQKQLDDVAARYEVGLIAITDLQETQARYDLSTAQELVAESSLAISNENLFVLTGIASAELFALDESAPLPKPEPSDIEQWSTAAQDANPTVITAEYDWQLARQEIQRRKGGRYPTVGVVAESGELQNDGGFSEGTSNETTIGLELKVPIYTGGLIKSQVAEARSIARAAEKQLELVRRNVARNTRAQYLNVISQISQVSALRQALASTKTAAAAAEAGFAAGTRTSVDVLIALSQTYAAQRNYSSARYDFIINSLKLKQSAGAVTEQDIKTINSWLTNNR